MKERREGRVKRKRGGGREEEERERGGGSVKGRSQLTTSMKAASLEIGIVV